MSRPNQVFILSLGIFSIINAEMGVIGILPLIAEFYQIDIATAGWLVGLFALVVSVAGPTMPLLFSGVNRKRAMLLVLGMFTVCNVISAFAADFSVALIVRVLPAFFHPIYCSLAFTIAAASVRPEDASKAISKVMMGVSAGMVLGVPIIGLIADLTSLRVAMLSFAVVNAAAFAATLWYMPSMPVTQRLSYGDQISVLKEPMVWSSIVSVVLLNGAVFGVYSYLAAYLADVTHLSVELASVLLFIYGLANIVGNLIAGRLLSSNAVRLVALFPFALVGLYFVLFIVGSYLWPMALLTLIWGILSGMGGNINQYWLVSAAPKAPEFANGLFLASTNLGTTLGAMLCGFLITSFGMQYVVIGGFLFAGCSVATIYLRVYGNRDVSLFNNPQEF